MVPLSFRLAPVSHVSGTGPRWLAEGEEPWFHLDTSTPLAGNWVRLTWRAGLGDAVSRPVLRCLHPTGEVNLLLPAAPFGRKQWTGYIPEGTTALHLSPVAGAGSFGFALDRVERLSVPEVLLASGARDFAATCLAVGARLIGRPRDFRSLISETLSGVTMNRYPALRESDTRAFDPVIDGVPASAGPSRLCCVVSPGDARQLAEIPLLANLLDHGQSMPLHIILRVPMQDRDHWRARAAQAGLDIGVEPENADLLRLTEALDAGDRLAILPQGARFAPNAVQALLQEATRHPEADILFGDEGTCDAAGTPMAIRLRSGFDPLLLGKTAHLGHAAFWRVDLVRRLAKGGSLHLGEDGISGVKIARVLLDVPVPDDLHGEIERILAPRLAVGVEVPREQANAEVAIIIPTRDRLDLLRQCIDSIIAHSRGAFRVVIIDNDSVEPSTHEYFRKLSEDSRFLVHAVPGRFNFSACCNAGAALVESPVLLFLNNDTHVLTPGWLDGMRAHALMPTTGAVGAKLLFPSGLVQHIGVVAGFGGRAGHIEAGLAREEAGFFGRAMLDHRLSAVTGACLAVERRKFEEIGGFDAVNLPVDLNDIDLCLRLGERGYHQVVLADCILFHHESASRGRSRAGDEIYADERSYFSKRWLSKLRDDPYYHPALSLYLSRPHLG